MSTSLPTFITYDLSLISDNRRPVVVTCQSCQLKWRTLYTIVDGRKYFDAADKKLICCSDQELVWHLDTLEDVEFPGDKNETVEEKETHMEEETIEDVESEPEPEAGSEPEPCPEPESTSADVEEEKPKKKDPFGEVNRQKFRSICSSFFPPDSLHFEAIVIAVGEILTNYFSFKWVVSRQGVIDEETVPYFASLFLDVVERVAPIRNISKTRKEIITLLKNHPEEISVGVVSHSFIRMALDTVKVFSERNHLFTHPINHICMEIYSFLTGKARGHQMTKRFVSRSTNSVALFCKKLKAEIDGMYLKEGYEYDNYYRYMKISHPLATIKSVDFCLTPETFEDSTLSLTLDEGERVAGLICDAMKEGKSGKRIFTREYVHESLLPRKKLLISKVEELATRIAQRRLGRTPTRAESLNASIISGSPEHSRVLLKGFRYTKEERRKKAGLVGPGNKSFSYYAMLYRRLLNYEYVRPDQIELMSLEDLNSIVSRRVGMKLPNDMERDYLMQRFRENSPYIRTPFGLRRSVNVVEEIAGRKCNGVRQVSYMDCHGRTLFYNRYEDGSALLFDMSFFVRNNSIDRKTLCKRIMAHMSSMSKTDALVLYQNLTDGESIDLINLSRDEIMQRVVDEIEE